MRAEKAIASLLNADAGVAAIVGTKIFGNAAPDETASPLLIYRKASATRVAQADPEPLQLVESSIEILCVAPTYAGLKELGEAVRVALIGQRGTVNGVDLLYVSLDEEGGDDYVPEIREHVQPWTFLVQHTE